MKKTSSFQNSLIWFGAAVSIAEILTGTYFAPLGFTKGLLAILVGHVIGCAMFFFAGLIGGRTGRSAMGTVELSFGRIGCLFFAALNVLQLVGWTAIMIYDGALATNTVLGIGKWVWCLVIGGLIVVWIAVGIKNLGWINKIAMAALFVLTLVLCKVIFFVRGGIPRRHTRHGAGRQPELRRGGRAGRGHAAVVAAAHLRLHARGRKALRRHALEHADLRRRELLDVRHRHGRRHLHR